MPWPVLALVAPVLWAASNWVDTTMVRSRSRSTLGLVSVTGLFGGLPAIAVVVAGRFESPTTAQIALGAGAGLVGLAAYYPYLRALESAHPASVVLMWNGSPVLVAVFAFAFLGERLAVTGYVAMALLVASAVIASQPSAGSRGSWNALAWMAMASLCSACEATLLKALYARTPVLTGMALDAIASFAGAVLLLAVAPSAREDVRRLGIRRTTGLVGLNEMMNLCSCVCVSFAISLAPVSLVKAVGGLQPLFVIMFGRVVRGTTGASSSQLAEFDPGLAAGVVATVLAVVGLGLLGTA